MLSDLLSFLTLLINALIDLPLLKVGMSVAVMVFILSIILFLIDFT